MISSSPPPPSTRNYAVAATPAAALPSGDETISLAAVWQHLASGDWLVVDTLTDGAGCGLVLDSTRSARGRLRRPRARDVDLLERVLLCHQQKAAAIELGLTESGVSGALSRCLKSMGVPGKGQRLPFLIAMSALASRGATQLERAHRLHTSASDAIVAWLPRPEWMLCDLLPPAELAVAGLVVDGLSQADIAGRRRTSKRTVANQVGSIFRRVGVSGRIELLCHLARRFALGTPGSKSVPS